MLIALKRELSEGLAETVRRLYGVDHEAVAEVAPRRELGDLAFPLALQLARELKQAPRKTAEEVLAAYEPPPVVDRIEIAGAGYLNVFLDRREIAARVLGEPVLSDACERALSTKVIVEHTNINPNKAAHIGHLRNAVLGDSLVRALRALGHRVEVQNYIDDTGVQLADVVVGFLDMEGIPAESVAPESGAEMETGDTGEPFDYLCWDLYSRVGQWYEQDAERKALRRRTLHAMETVALGVDDVAALTGEERERAAVGERIARRIVQRHLTTMARIDVGYDLLTRESEVLGRRFFARAFDALRERGAIRLETEGKNQGCWVMPLSQSEEFAGLEDPDKVIVRSDDTVTYVGKDIAYQLWKFGLLGEDFQYRFWDAEEVWETAPPESGAPSGNQAPDFGEADRVINVIDARQSYLQKIVRAGLEALGHKQEAARSIHFAYEMVALSAATARQLGYGDDDSGDGDKGSGPAGGKAMEMSGRRGIGVKADDLLDQLEEKARREIESRNRDLSDAELGHLTRQIATAALRFLMVKTTTTRLIAFDLDEALAFEGESGPYLQYSGVRVPNIRRRLQEEGLADGVTPDELRALPAEVWADDLWDLVFEVTRIDDLLEKVGDSLEISLLARHALELAQRFNAFYHRHPILHEEDSEQRAVRLATALIFRRGLETLTSLLGIPLPDRM